MVFTDLVKQARGVNLASFALWCGSSAYIVCIFQAVGLSMHYQVTGYPLPSPESQFHVGLTISVMRGVTFLFGNLIGVLTLRTGRKTMMWSALAIGYLPTFSIFLIGWLSRPTYPPLYAGSKLTVPCAGTAMAPTFNWTKFNAGGQAAYPPCTIPGTMATYYIGYIICGIFAPYYPHAVGYVADISTGDRAVGNQAKLSGVGYANGLACGYVMAVIILLGAGTGDAVVGYHGNFITISLITGLAIIGLGVITLITRLDESMPVKDRPKVLPWKEANPLAMCTICGTSSYTAAIQLFIFISNIGAAGSEAAIGVLYAMSFYSKNGPKYVLPLLIFIMAIFFANAAGSVLVANRLKNLMGFKNAFHLAIIGTICCSGIPLMLFPTTHNSMMQWITVLGSLLFGGCLQPYTLAWFMGQAQTPADKTLYSGIFRVTQAAGKAVGALIVGVLIAPGWVNGMKLEMASGCIEDNIKPCAKTGTCEAGAVLTTPCLAGFKKPYAMAFFLPFLAYVLMPLVAWLCLISAEVCCKNQDKEGWRGENDTNKGFTDAFATKKSLSNMNKVRDLDSLDAKKPTGELDATVE